MKFLLNKSLQYLNIPLSPLERGTIQRLIDNHRYQILTSITTISSNTTVPIPGTDIGISLLPYGGLFSNIAEALKQLQDQPGFVCPLTKRTFKEPLFSFSTGLSYEQSALNAHLLKHGNKCPITHKPLLPLIPNHTLRKLIEELPQKLKRTDSFARRYRQFCALFVWAMKKIGIKVDEAYFLPDRIDNLNETRDPFMRIAFDNPGIFRDGHTYNINNMLNWLASHGTSPMTSERINGHHCANTDLVKAINSINTFLLPEQELNEFASRFKRITRA